MDMSDGLEMRQTDAMRASLIVVSLTKAGV